MVTRTHASLAFLLASHYAVAATTPDAAANIAAAATDPARGADASQDTRRHGPEILAFAGVAPGAKILDLIPGAGYWTRLFAKAVGPNGHVYGIWPLPYASEVANYRLLVKSNHYSNVSAAVEPANALSVPEKLDLVFTAQNYHDYLDKFMGSLDPSVLNKAVFQALKPGGVYLIIDHVAAAGSGLRDTDTLHRIDPASVREEVTAAGFVFVGESRILANPADDHSKPVFDKSIQGHTDQFIYKFRKPA